MTSMPFHSIGIEEGSIPEANRFGYKLVKINTIPYPEVDFLNENRQFAGILYVYETSEVS